VRQDFAHDRAGGHGLPHAAVAYPTARYFPRHRGFARAADSLTARAQIDALRAAGLGRRTPGPVDPGHRLRAAHR